MRITVLLFDFEDPESSRLFSPVDDRVMGGVSRSRLRAGEGCAVFEGELSTERNGGFASVRSDPRALDLEGRLAGDAGLALRVRGDGRTYRVRLRTDERFDGVSYQAPLPTSPGRWTTVALTFAAFRPMFRGRAVPDHPPLDPAAVRSLGLLVAEGQVGSFRLEIAWIGGSGPDGRPTPD